MPMLADAHISSLGYLWGTQQGTLREGSAPEVQPIPILVTRAPRLNL